MRIFLRIPSGTMASPESSCRGSFTFLYCSACGNGSPLPHFPRPHSPLSTPPTRASLSCQHPVQHANRTRQILALLHALRSNSAHANVCVRESCIFVDLITDSRIYDGFVMHVLRSGNLKSSKTRSMCPVAPMACLAAVISAALFKKL